MISAKSVLCGVLVLMAGWCAPIAAADPAGKTNQDAPRAARLKLLRQLAEKVQVSVVDAENKATPQKMVAEPLYRYSQESRSYPDAVVWAWSDGGRPAALLTLACNIGPNRQELTYEFDSLSTKPLICKNEGQEFWTPRGPGLEMRSLGGTPTPAEDRAGRLQQIGELIGRMKASEVIVEDGESKKTDLSWLSQPVYRYSDPANGVVDGALCFACIETNPEVLLVLEVHRRGQSPAAWHFGFNRVSYAALSVLMDDKKLWTAPVISSGTSPGEPYYLVPVSLRPR